MAKRQHYGITFPITAKSFEKTLLDLNLNPADGVKSQIMHLIFTPIGQRLRKPLFGSKLIQFIFNPNDSQTWGDVVRDIKEMIANNIPDCSIDNVEVYEVEDGLGLMAHIKYTVKENGVEYQDEIITEL